MLDSLLVKCFCVLDFKELSRRPKNTKTTAELQLDELCTLVETLNNWTVIERVGAVIIGHMYYTYSTSVLIGGVAQWYNVGLWLANFPCPVFDLQLMGDH